MVDPVDFSALSVEWMRALSLLYYGDFGTLEQLAQAYRRPFIYAWDYIYAWDCSAHRQRFHGDDPSDCPASRFVVCSQNHDQVGNRALGERLSALLLFPALKLAAAVLLSPYVPLLFMGEQYGEPRPFLYFNPELGGMERFAMPVQHLKKLGLGGVQDIVPNHRVFHTQNRVLVDMLGNGPDSPCHEFFDINWNHLSGWNRMAPMSKPCSGSPSG